MEQCMGGQGAKIMDMGEDMNVDRVRMKVVIGQRAREIWVVGVVVVVVTIKLGMSNPAFVFGENGGSGMEEEIFDQKAGRRGRGGEELYGSSMKTSTAVYKDSGIDTSHTRNFVFLSLGRLHLFVSLALVFLLAAGRGYRLVSGVPDCRDLE